MDRIKNAPRTVFICALLGILTWAAFWPVLRNGFVNYDDPEYVTENPHVQTGLTAANIRWALTSQHGGNWHPLTSVSHMLDVQLFGLKASWHHGINLLFHTANALLLYLLLQGLTARMWRSAFVAALFALHPLHVESVAWVAERKDVLSGFFGLLTLLAYAKYATQKPEANPKAETRKRMFYYSLAFVLFALGLMSKPMLVTWPFVMLLLDYWPLNRGHGRIWFPLVMEKLPFFGLTAASCVMTFFVQKASGAVVPLNDTPIAARVANAVVSYGHYLAKTFWPSKLAVFYPYEQLSWDSGEVVGAFAVIVLLTGTALWVWKRKP